jgi:hypothetical protein
MAPASLQTASDGRKIVRTKKQLEKVGVLLSSIEDGDYSYFLEEAEKLNVKNPILVLLAIPKKEEKHGAWGLIQLWNDPAQWQVILEDEHGYFEKNGCVYVLEGDRYEFRE